MKQLLISAILIAGMAGGAAYADNEPYRNPNLSADQRAADLLSRMTLEEKISQMTNGSDPIERLGIPQYDWWNEALHGVGRAGLATVFPQAIGMAATFDNEALEHTFDMISDEARAKYNHFQELGERTGYKGLTFWTPNVNIFRDPRWGRGQETYGEDPYLTSTMGLAAVRGLQGDGTSKYDKTHACAKHYAVHSGPEWNRHSFDAKNVSPRDLHETYLPAFETLVKKGKVKEVMCAYNRFDGEPCCSNKELLTQILRDEWGYDDIVVSDCGAISDFFRPGAHLTHPDAPSASADAVLTGTDLNCGAAYKSLNEAVEKGFITEEQIDESVFRLLRARFQLGMFDDPALVSWNSIPYSVVDSEEHKAQVLEMARKSMTLLSNNGVLPLRKDIKKIAVVGPNANDSIMMWGNYNGTPSHTVTILEGIKDKFPDVEVVYEKGCELTGYPIDKKEQPLPADADYQKGIAEKVRDADVIIFAGGLSPEIEGEEMPVDIPGFKKGDRTDINLPDVQKNMLAALKQTGKPVVFVVCTGSALALKDEVEMTDAMLLAWYPGQAGGAAVADVVAGDYNPAGRLPITFYASSEDLPDYEDYNMANRTYRYFNGSPLFHFGHGLSYTSFEYGDAKLSSKVYRSGKPLTVTVPVKNTGALAGDEVVQLYLRNINDIAGPKLTLRGYQRVTLAPGEEKNVTFTLTPADLAWYDPKSFSMTLLPGDYLLLYGGTSDPAKLQTLPLKIKK